MDNIKQLREKIESFITCSDRRCPTLSERYQRHRIKHHSLQRNQPPQPESPSVRSSSSHSYGKEKATASLGTHAEEKVFEEYDNVKEEIMDWSKDLPVYHNLKFEDIKQNVVNELIENINNLFKEKNTMENLLDSLKHEITEKIYSMPLTYEQQKIFESNLLRRFQITKGNTSSGLKVGKNILYYNKENLNESLTKLHSNTVRNSYIDLINNMSPVLLTDFKFTTVNDGNNINFQLYKSGSYAGLKPNDFNNDTHKVLSLCVCKSQIYKGIIVRNKNVFEISDYTATIVEYQNILGDSTFDIQNKLSVSDISTQRMSYSKGIRIDAATKSSHRSSGSCISIYRSEDKNIVNSNFLSIPTNNNEFELSVCDLDSFRDTLFNWLLEKQSFLKHKVSPNKKNAAISKMSKTLYGHIKSIKDPRNIYTDVNKLLNKLLKPEFKDDIKVLSNELIERLYTSLPKTKNTFDDVLVNNETQASTCTNIDTDTLECSLTKLLHKYIEALSEEESIFMKEVYRSLFKNKIQSMLVSKFCTKNSGIKDQENVLSYRLKIDIEYIEILAEWFKSITREINISNLQESSIILIEIIEIIKSKEDDVTEIRKSNEIFKRKFSNKLSFLIPSDSKIDTDKLLNELLQKHLKHSQKSICKECYNQNRSDAIDNYFYHHGEDIIKQNLKFNILLKRILREIKYHCLCNLPHTLINNDFQYVKEICHWLKNLPLLPANEEKVRKKIVNTIANFIDEININIGQEDDDSYIKNFIVALPLNKEKEVDIQLALLQLKKRLQHIDKINFENKMDIGVKEERIPKINIVSDIEKWCQKLPTTVSDDKTTTILKQRLAWNLLKKFGELNMNSHYYGKGNKRLYENDVTLEIDKQLNESRLNETLDDTAESAKIQLLNIFIENLEAIKNKHPSEKYVLHLRNLIELSLRNNANINKEEDAVLLNKIRDVLVYLSLLRQFERNDDELTQKYYLFLVEEICAYLQYAKTLFMVPFLYDPNQDLLSYNVDQYKNHQFIEKLLRFFKTRSVLGLWLETLPLQKPNGTEAVFHKYDMITELTDLVIGIEDKYNYKDPNIDKALMKCIQILPLSASSLERLVVDLKNILIRTLKERNNNTNATEENDNPISNQNNSVMLLDSNKSAEHISKTTKDEDEIQNNSKSLKMKTNHWYSLPPASTITDHTKNYSTLYENYNEEQNVHESQSKLHESSINYKDFEKGVDLKSSVTEPSPLKQTAHSSTHRTTQHEPIVPKYEDFQKGVDFNSSLIESSHMKERSESTQTADYKGAKRDNSPTKELIKSSHKEAQTSLRKLSSLGYQGIEAGLETNKSFDPDCRPQKLSQTSSVTAIFSKEEACHKKPEKNSVEQFNENSETYNKEKTQKTYNNRCVPNCKPQKSSQTSSLTAIFPKKEATHEKPERNSVERLTETSGTFKQDNGKDDTTCNCQRKCLPCYIRRYCKICSSLPLKYHELHFW